MSQGIFELLSASSSITDHLEYLYVDTPPSSLSPSIEQPSTSTFRHDPSDSMSMTINIESSDDDDDNNAGDNHDNRYEAISPFSTLDGGATATAAAAAFPGPDTALRYGQQSYSNTETFLSIEEANLINLHFEYLSTFGHAFRSVSQMFLDIYYLIHTRPIIPMCKRCVESYCLNYSVFHIIDYIFTDQVCTSFRAEFYCSVCLKRLFNLTSAKLMFDDRRILYATVYKKNMLCDLYHILL